MTRLMCNGVFNHAFITSSWLSRTRRTEEFLKSASSFRSVSNRWRCGQE